jgi:3-oxoacyl-[acyl-carrier protein] reductase
MVYPPVTDTGWVTSAIEQAVAGSPLGHVAHPDEVAEVIVLLASHQARHLTGQVIRMS